jgi:pyruvate dehydrogenase E2 component (dihydrolipoamide acetyltransferase)
LAKIETLLVPDIGGSNQVDVIDIAIKVGDVVTLEQTLITLEGDKATMDVPASQAGKILEILVKVGDKVSQGSAIVKIESVAQEAFEKPQEKTAEKFGEKSVVPPKVQTVSENKKPSPTPVVNSMQEVKDRVSNGALAYAGPGVRRFAYELGVDLRKISGTGRKGRIVKEDVQQFVKAVMQTPPSSSFVSGLPPLPKIDFSKFGTVNVQALSKIQKISGANLHRNWVQIPHVTQFDEADVTDLENFRNELRPIAEKEGFKLTALVFIMKAVVATLKEFPTVNASLDEKGESLILKQYFHIGVAVDTPNGLVVPVIRDVDQKGFVQLAKELADVSQKAREKGLTPTDMQGGCFTISSLGGISGTGFTPIINAPEVGILGVSRMQMKPVYLEGEFKPRLMLPLSFSYDHRVIDGALAARFTKTLTRYLTDIRQILL